MNFWTPLATTAMTVASSFATLIIYDRFGHVEPMVAVKPSGRLMNVHLSGVAAPVKATDIQHEGIECLEKHNFHFVRKADYLVLPGNTQKGDPVFTFVSDPSHYSDVTYVKFAEACLNCRAATHIKYKDFFGFEKEKRLPWF